MFPNIQVSMLSMATHVPKEVRGTTFPAAPAFPSEARVAECKPPAFPEWARKWNPDLWTWLWCAHGTPSEGLTKQKGKAEFKRLRGEAVAANVLGASDIGVDAMYAAFKRSFDEARAAE